MSLPNPDMWQQLSTVQSRQDTDPVTLASAATVAPTTFLTRITGTTPISTITPPVDGMHLLCFVWTTGTSGAFAATGGTGNGQVAVAKTTVTNVPVLAVYDPRTTLYYFL